MYLFVLYIFVYSYIVNGVDLSSSRQHDQGAAETARLIHFIKNINDFEEKYSSVANNNDVSKDLDAENESTKLIQNMLDEGRKFNKMADQANVLHISNPEVLQTYRHLPEIREERRNFAKEQVPGLPNNSINNRKDAGLETLQSMELFDLVKPIVQKIMTKYKVKMGPDDGELKENIRKGPEIENQTTNAEKSMSDSIVNEEKTDRTKKKRQDSSNKKEKPNKKKDKKIKKIKNKEKFNADIIDTKHMMDEHIIDWADYDEKKDEDKSESDADKKSNKKKSKGGIKSGSKNKKDKVRKKKNKSENKNVDSWNKYVDDTLFKDGDKSNEKKKKGAITDDDKNNKNHGHASGNKMKTRYKVKKYLADANIKTDQKSSSEQDSAELFRSMRDRLGGMEREGDMDDLKKEWFKIAPNVKEFYKTARKRGRIFALGSIPFGGKNN